MAKNDNLTDFLTDVADAIREKEGSTDLINPQDFSDRIRAIETGGGEGASGGGADDVRFIDYDGTILHTFSKGDFLALTEMPSLPSRSGLICQGWNWSLADAQSYVEKYGKQTIGATYITDDGKTRLYINIADKGRMSVPLRMSISKSNGVIINWGDGSAEEVYPTSGTIVTHIYTEIGNYVITLSPSDDCTITFSGSNNYNTMGAIGAEMTYANMLQKVHIGARVDIGNYAFYQCFSLSSVTIPNGVTSIGQYAFYLCYALSSETIPNGVTSIGQYAFHTSGISFLSMPATLTSLNQYSFYQCRRLISANVAEGTTSIPLDCFEKNHSLESVTIPDSVKSIGGHAFDGCYALRSVSAKGVETMPGYAFQYCYSLGSVDMPNVKSIGAYEFAYCAKLRSISFPLLKSIGDYAFAYSSGLDDITLPDSVTSIGQSAFRECRAMRTIRLPNNITALPNTIFYSCSGFAKINIPNKVTSIGQNAFYYCSSLARIVFPASVSSIAAGAFSYCRGPAVFDFRSHTAVPTLANTSAFGNISTNAKIVVPDELYDDWIAASNWSTYASKIVKASEYTE